MLILYGRHYFARYRTLADLIEPESSVLDLCCGPAILYDRHLRYKSVKYTGLDLNAKFINRLGKKGQHGLVWDLRREKALPPADYVVMQASLFHFLPDARRVVDGMLEAARKQVIIAEPIRNLARSKIPLVAMLGKHLTDPGTGQQPMRFTEQSLDDFFTAYASHVDRAFLIPGGREKIYVLNTTSSQQNSPVDSIVSLKRTI